MTVTTERAPQRGAIQWGNVIPAVAFALIALLVCGVLGAWQWSRANQQSVTTNPEPAVPLAEVLAPASSPGAAIGRQVTVTGEWADADAAVIWGREVDGEPAMFLVRPLTVSAAHTGTGEPATLPVLVGFRNGADPRPADPQYGDVTVTGYLRASEAASVRADVPDVAVAGAYSSTTMSTAEFANRWSSPLYSAVMVSFDGSTSWQPLPPRPPETSLDFRSVAYAIEWWIFGAFFAFIAARWIRDNGRTPVNAGDTERAASNEEDHPRD